MATPIVVELGSDKKNVNPYLEQVGEAYRGIRRTSNASVAEQMCSENFGIPEHIPGYCVKVDIDAKTVTLYDPLKEERYTETRKRLEHYLSHPAPRVPKRTYKPKDDNVTQNCSTSLMFHWLKQLWILCENDQAQLRKGSWPKAVVERIQEDRNDDAEKVLGSLKEAPALV